MRGTPRAFVLALTLVMTAVAFAFLVYSDPSVAGFRLAEDLRRDFDAGNAAYSCLDAVTDALIYDPVGTATANNGTYKVTLPDYSGMPVPATGEIVFAPGGTLAYSTNNFSGTAPVKGFAGRQVPPHFYHLASNGQVASNAANLLHTVVRQSLVRPHYTWFVDTFGGGLSGLWTFQGTPQLAAVQGGFLVLGSLDPSIGHEMFARAGNPWWDSYDFQADVAVYGSSVANSTSTTFAMLFHMSTAMEGYGIMITPVVQNFLVQGARMQLYEFISGGSDAQFDPVAEQDIEGSPFASTVPLTTQPAFWHLRVSVDQGSVWLSMVDSTNQFVQVGTPFSLLDVQTGSPSAPGASPTTPPPSGGPSAAPAHQAHTAPGSTGPPVIPVSPGQLTYPSGAIGFYTQPGSEIAVTNVVVNKRGTSMIYIPSQWESIGSSH